MAKKRKIELVCEECDQSCTIQCTGKEIIHHCPFCGEVVHVLDDEPPLLNDFEDLDEFDDSDYWMSDTRDDEEE